MTLTFVDFNAKTTSISFDGQPITAKNFEAVQAKQLALRDGLRGIVRGTLKSTWIAGNFTQTAAIKSDNSRAQVTNKWRIAYQDERGAISTFTIGTADLSLAKNSYAGRQSISILPLNEGAGLVFKTAFEDYVIATDGSQVRLETIQLI